MTNFLSRNYIYYCLLNPDKYFCVTVGVVVCNSAQNEFPKHFRVRNPKVCHSEILASHEERDYT